MFEPAIPISSQQVGITMAVALGSFGVAEAVVPTASTSVNRGCPAFVLPRVL